jgi:hypothetical protein
MNFLLDFCPADNGKGKWPHAAAIDAACQMGANVVEKVKTVIFLLHISQGFPISY